MFTNLLLWQYGIVTRGWKPKAGHTSGTCAGLFILAGIFIIDVVIIVTAVAALFWLAL